MREIRLSGSEGGGTQVLPTPIVESRSSIESRLIENHAFGGGVPLYSCAYPTETTACTICDALG